MIELHIDYIKNVNYALLHNHIPVCSSIELTNIGEDDLLDISVSIGGSFVQEQQSALYSRIDRGSTVRINDVAVLPKVDALLELSERVISSFTVQVHRGDEVLLSKEYELELMAFDQWLGTQIVPQCLASFVVPNQPAISQMVVKASALLKQMTGASAFVEYQDGDPNTVVAQVSAIFAALHQEGIIYRAVPASYERIGQRITLSDQVLETHQGNCIELTLLMASVLEAVGIYSGVVLMRGHAFLGVWLSESCYRQSICDDASFLEKACSEGISEMLVLECTELTKENASFERAQETARQMLMKSEEFDVFIDLRRCRLEGIISLPTRISEGGKWKIAPEDTPKHAACTVELTHRTRYDLDQAYDEKTEVNKLDIWERKLLDFSLRNNFLNLSIRSRAIQFISFDVASIEDYLQENTEYCIHPIPEGAVRVDREERLLRSSMVSALEPLVLNDITKQKLLHTYYSEEETQQVLKNIYRHARTTREETGANPLYLAIGLLRWYEKKNSPKARYAPLLLLPVDLVYKRGRYYVRKRDEEISLNITLIEYIRQTYGIRIKGIDPLPHDEHGVDVPLVFAQVRDALREQSKWDVEEECVLGTFSFNKYLMWHDIHNHREQLISHPVVSSLVSGSLQWQPQPLQTNLAEEDKHLAPGSIALPVPVDSSQLSAVLEAGRGSSFILYGPPGTGKSQTITNLIANALYQGRRVLFVAEKMAALSVVQKRLEKIGLGPFCLELHSNKVTKKHVLEQLDKALHAAKIREPEEYDAVAQKLYERRTLLIQYLESLHEDREGSKFSLYECISRYESYDVEPLTVSLNEKLAHLDGELLTIYEELLGSKLPAVLNVVGQPSEHPLVGLYPTLDCIQDPQTLARLLDEGAALAERIQRARALLAEILGADLEDSELSFRLGLDLLSVISSSPLTQSSVASVAFDARQKDQLYSIWEHMKNRDELHRMLTADCREEFLEVDALSLLQEWKAIQDTWFLPRFFSSRSYLKKLSFYSDKLQNQTVAAYLERVLEYQKEVKYCVDNSSVMQQLLGSTLSTEELGGVVEYLPRLAQAVESLADALHLSVPSVQDRIKSIPSEELSHKLQGLDTLPDEWSQYLKQSEPWVTYHFPSDRPFSESLSSRFVCWQANQGQIAKWYSWAQLRGELSSQGLDVIVQEVESTQVDAAQLTNAFFKGLYRALAEQKISRSELLCTFEGELFDQQVQRYKDLTAEFQELSKKMLYARLSNQLPHVYEDLDNSSEIGRLNRNIANGGRGTSIRQLLDDIPNLLPRLCPCMLMSPMSVAQYIDLGAEKYDLVVFDEASQMPTSEAIGAIARGNALVVVGDPKQMPPTSFFGTNSVDEEEESIDDLESILQDCQALSLPSLQLNWHYRSRHESLIAFSNHEYYDGELITFPSVDDQATKVRFIQVKGSYDKGKTRQNKAEAEAIVHEVCRRLRDENLRGESMGIVAFSAAQQNLIEDTLTDCMARDASLQELADQLHEPIFIKNLENVQGDERDVILFSIGYGADSMGQLSMNFGPLNKVGGERRLNVAVSRARCEMLVFSTMTSDQIDLRRTKAKGVEGLKHFLEYAERQTLARRPQSDSDSADRIIAEQIADRLQRAGYPAMIQLGRSSFKVNLAVALPSAPDCYRLGILIDGETYRRTQTTRDREVGQPGVLGNLNWEVMRVWSPDWFRQPDLVIERILTRLNSLPESPVKPQSAPVTSPFSITEAEIIAEPTTSSAALEYPDTESYVSTSLEAFVREVVTREQPITYSLLSKRVAAFKSFTRVTPTITGIVDSLLPLFYTSLDREGFVLWKSQADQEHWEGYRPNTAETKRSIEEIPSVELMEVLLEVVKQNISIAPDAATLSAAKRMGFSRRGANVEAAFTYALEQLLKNGLLAENEGKLLLPQ
jgi:hypothetical protein